MTNNSFIVSFLTNLSVRLYSVLAGSFLARIFVVSDKADKVCSEGTLSIMAKNPITEKFLPAVRRRFSQNVESSVIVSLYRKLIKALLVTSVRTTGSFLLSASLFSMLVILLKVIESGMNFDQYADLVAVASVFVISLLMLCSGKSNAVKIYDSRILSLIFFDLLGINPMTLDISSPAVNRYSAASLLGIPVGLVCYVLSPIRLIMLTVALILAFVILYSPESGLLISLVCITAGSETAYVFLSMALLSYVLKLLRGKRNFSLKSEDAFALLLAMMYAFGVETADIPQTIVFVSAYFMASNLLRSKALIKRSLTCISVGLFINSLLNVVAYVLNLLVKQKIVRYGYVSVFTENIKVEYGFLTVMAFLLSFFLLTDKKNAFSPFIRFCAFLVTAFDVAVSSSETIWIFSLVGILVYQIYRSSKLFNALFTFAVLTPVLLYARNIYDFYFEVTPFSAFPLPYAASNAHALIFGGQHMGEGTYGDVMSAFGLFGCLLLAATVYLLISRAYTSSALDKTEMRRYCGILVSAVLMFFAVGISINTFENEMYLLLFWLICGIISSTGNASLRSSSIKAFDYM